MPHARAQADSLVYQAEKQVKELGDKAPADNKAKVEDKIKVLFAAEHRPHRGLHVLCWLVQDFMRACWGLHGPVSGG